MNITVKRCALPRTSFTTRVHTAPLGRGTRLQCVPSLVLKQCVIPTLNPTAPFSALLVAGARKRQVAYDEAANGSEYRCLVRAVDNKRTISTVLSARDYARFNTSYSNLQKVRMEEGGVVGVGCQYT